MFAVAAVVALWALRADAAKKDKLVEWPEDVALMEERHNCWSTNNTRIDLTNQLPGLRTSPPTVAQCAEAAREDARCGWAIELRRPESTVRYCGCGKAGTENEVCQQEHEKRRLLNSSDTYALHGAHHRTAERVAAGKKAAEHIACLVCESQITSVAAAPASRRGVREWRSDRQTQQRQGPLQH